LTDNAFRCSDEAEARDEPIHGTASQVSNWLLIEQPGAWGRDALLESRMPVDVAGALRDTTKALGVRVILIRRGPRLASDRRNVYFARTHPSGSWVSHAFVDDAQELLELDLEPLTRGERVQRTDPVDHPLFLVCTHGRHDTCCSIKGNQVSRLACTAYPAFSWECSHIGGDRFAANLVCFPYGVYYGRVTAAELIDIAEAYRHGWLSLNHYRGRCSYPFDVQAAEFFLRRDRNLLGLDEVRLEGYERNGKQSVEAAFTIGDGRSVSVVVRRSLSESTYRLTCDADKENPIPSYELVSLEPSS
jgi:hypothetical protein